MSDGRCRIALMLLVSSRRVARAEHEFRCPDRFKSAPASFVAETALPAFPQPRKFSQSNVGVFACSSFCTGREPALLELYGDLRERTSSEVPIQIRTVRPATAEEIEFWKWHSEKVSSDTREGGVRLESSASQLHLC